MRFLMIILAFMLNGAQAAEPPVFEGPQNEIDAILAVFAEWGAARESGDSEAVANFYHEDMMVMTRDREIFHGREGARAFYTENYSADSERELFSNMMEMRVLGDVAIVTGQFLVLDPTKGIEDPGNFLLIMRKNAAGEWLVYRDIDTPSPDGLALRPTLLQD